MCTLSWARVEEGYELFFNRDERRTRGPELAPALFERGGVRCCAPRDADHGGTWIVANARGTTVCLLNGYTHEQAVEGERESRGLLVLELADAADAREVKARFSRALAERFRPFVLVALDPDESALAVEWDGRELSIDPCADARLPLISSSFAEPAVRERRNASYHERVGAAPDPLALRAFHASHDGGPSAYSVCMHREEAETRSCTRVRVTSGRVELAHTPGPPCRTNASAPLAFSRER